MTTIVWSDFGVEVDVEAPAEDEVVDVMELDELVGDDSDDVDSSND